MPKTSDRHTIAVGGGITFDGTIAIGDVALRSGATTLGKAVITFPGSSKQYGHGGNLPVGTTAFFTFQQIQSTLFNVFIAQAAATVSKLQIDSVTGNGAAHTDTYTVFKNGVATAMVLTVTNASTGNTILNPVALVAGDRVAVQVVTDAATAATDVTVTLDFT